MVENLEAALAMAAADVAGHRFVTTSGETVEPDGRVSLGPESVSARLLSRRSELKDIELQVADNDERIATLADQLNRTQAEATHLEELQHELRSALSESNTAKVEAGVSLENLRDALGRLTTEQPMIAQEVVLIEQQIEETLARSADGDRSLEELERQNNERQRLIEKQQERIDEVVATRRQVQEQLTEVKVEAAQLSEKRAAVSETVAALLRTIRELESAAEAARLDIQQCRARIGEAQDVITTGREALTGLETTIQQLEESSTKLRQQRETLRLDLEKLSQAVRTTRDRLTTVEAQLHEHQTSLAESRVRRDDLAIRIREELGIDLSEAYKEYDHQDQDWAQVEARIAELRGKMDRLGHVNVDAITELHELEERHSFLAGQRDDLTGSQKQLEQLIDKLNEDSQRRFQTAFDQIREHFRTMFRRLFGGGRAEITLEDPNNVLDCGIEIVAQPPGKELLNISLMSGGEKSMTAIALLMSIFKSRPAPFVILDEVDAALDEANNERFNQIVQEFVGTVQFIIITHSKWTMNTADHLYGITMQEPGVSTRVSVQLTGANVA